jgi:hypothetical protein
MDHHIPGGFSISNLWIEAAGYGAPHSGYSTDFGPRFDVVCRIRTLWRARSVELSEYYKL